MTDLLILALQVKRSQYGLPYLRIILLRFKSEYSVLLYGIFVEDYLLLYVAFL